MIHRQTQLNESYEEIGKLPCANAKYYINTHRPTRFRHS